MRVTTGPRKHFVTVLVAASILLSSLLLLVAAGGVPRRDAPAPSGVRTAGEATVETGGDTGYVNPWEAGNAAALQELAELGRRTQLGACP
jgi:hypothetical protein